MITRLCRTPDSSQRLVLIASAYTILEPLAAIPKRNTRNRPELRGRHVTNWAHLVGEACR